MKKNKIVIANWKMNKTVSESQKFISELINDSTLKNYKNVIICPSFLSIMSILKKCLKNNIKLGAQNCFYEDIGSFTGEVSPIMLKKAGIEYVIIGHSERRIKLNETPDIINKKLFAALKNKLKVILCVGETKTEKDCGTEKSVILNQINSAVYDLQEIDLLNNLVIAYEPVWAIGNSNANVDPLYAEKMCAFIKDFININFRKKINVLYGGSLNSKNAEIFLKMENIDGGLIGGASLDIKEFSEIIKISQNLYIS